MRRSAFSSVAHGSSVPAGADENGENSAIGTTNAIKFCIADNGFVSDGQSTEITESLYQQLVNEVRQYVPFSHIATMEEAAAYLGY